MNIFRKYNIALAIFVGICIIIPAGFFGTRSFLAQIEENIELLQTRKIDQQVQQNFLLKSDILQKQKDLIESNKTNIDVLLAQDDNAVIDLYAEIESLSRASLNTDTTLNVTQYKKSSAPTGVPVGRNVPEPTDGEIAKSVPVVKKGFSVAPVTGQFLYLRVTTVGTYNNFLTFLNKLENMPNFSDVINLSVHVHSRGTVSGDDGRSNLVTSNIDVAFYFAGGRAVEEKVTNPAIGLEERQLIAPK